MADNQKDNPDAHCLPMGFMQLHRHPQPRKIIQTPELIVIMYEGNQGLRQIFMDGRPLPEVNEDLQPWWYGYSVGHWEGDTLVVESDGFRDDGWLDVYGSPLTEQGKLIERLRRPDLRPPRDRRHRRRSEGVHEAVHRTREPSAHGRPRADRVHLQREREVLAALRSMIPRSTE